MSSSTVRAAARALVADATWPAGLPFRETVEQAPDEGRPEPGALAAWCTLDFEAQSDAAIGLGADSLLRETGRVVVRCFGTGHAGDAALLALAELAAAAVRAWPWAADGIFVADVSPPTPSGDTDATWAELAILIDYERDHVP